MRVVVRRERPHPGAQITCSRAHDGWRYQAFATDTATGQLAWLEARHRAHARVEDNIRNGKAGRAESLPVPGVRYQPDLAAAGPDRRRPDLLDPDHPADRRPLATGRTEDAALPATARRRPTRPRTAQNQDQNRYRLALGTRTRRRVQPTLSDRLPLDYLTVQTDLPLQPGTPETRIPDRQTSLPSSPSHPSSVTDDQRVSHRQHLPKDPGASEPKRSCWTVGFCEDLVGGFGPDEGLAAVVPAVDEGSDFDHQVADRGVSAAVDGLAFDDAEPDLDQVQPRSRRGGEVDVDPRVRRQLGLDVGVLVGGVVVYDQMQLLVGIGSGTFVL